MTSNQLTLLFFIPLVIGCLLITALFVLDSIKEYIHRLRNFKTLKERMTDWSQTQPTQSKISATNNISEVEYIEEETMHDISLRSREKQ